MVEQSPHAAGGKQPARRGRKFGPIQARSQEYEALAGFLRKRVEDAGLTLGELGAATGLKKSAISERLAGQKIDAAFVDAVVTACTQSPEVRPKRVRLREEGARLLKIATERKTAVVDLSRQPPSVRNAVVTAQEMTLKAQAKAIDLHEELDRRNAELARLAAVQRQSHQALHEAETLSSVLSTWVVVLANEVERLGREREQAMVARPPDTARLTSVDTELARTIAQHSRTAAGMSRVQQDTRLATALLAETLTRTRRVRDQVRRLRAASQLPQRDGAGAEVQLPPVPDSIASPGAFGEDIDDALDRAEVAGRAIAHRLRIALTNFDEEAETLPLSAASTADNDVTSANAADNGPTGSALWWDMLAHIPTSTFLWAEETATALVREREAHDPRLERIATERPVREALLVADRLEELRWLEGAARLRTALALVLAPDVLTPLIVAMAGAGTFMRRAEQGAQLLRVALAGRSTDDTLALYIQLSNGDGDTLPVVGDGLAAIAQRPYADVVALVGQQLADNPRLLTHGRLLEAIVHRWAPGEVVDLIKEVVDIEDGYLAWQVFFALPAPPARQAELLVRLWNVVPDDLCFREMLPGLYGPDTDLDDLTEIITAVHTEWPPPLDSAARGLAGLVMPLIIRRSNLEKLSIISERLAQRGLAPERIFEPYKELFNPGITSD